MLKAKQYNFLTKKYETGERRELDFYETPPALVKALIDRVHIDGTVFEPTAGDLAIARFFPDCLTNDIDSDKDTQTHFDMTLPESWEYFNRPQDWVITNPPFSVASKILPYAFDWAVKGVAFLLRLSYFEPTEDRGTWLTQHGLYHSNTIVFNPRPKFKLNKKGQASSDSATVAWFVWEKSHNIFNMGTDIQYVMGWNK